MSILPMLVRCEVRHSSYKDDWQYYAGYLSSAVHVRCDRSAALQGNFFDASNSTRKNRFACYGCEYVVEL